MLAMALGKAARSRGSSLNTATRAMSTLTSTQACHDGILEMREYTLYPQGMREFIQASSDKAELRKSLLPFLG